MCEEVARVFSKRMMPFIFAYVWDNRVIKVGSIEDLERLNLKSRRGIVLEMFTESWLRISSLVYLEKIERKASSA